MSFLIRLMFFMIIHREFSLDSCVFSASELGLQHLRFSEVNVDLSLADIKQNQIKAIKKPDESGTIAIRSIRHM